MAVEPEDLPPISDDGVALPDEQTANLDPSFIRSQPPDSRTRRAERESCSNKEPVDDVAKTIDLDATSTRPLRVRNDSVSGATGLPPEPLMSILETERSAVQQPVGDQKKNDSADEEVSKPETADDPADQAYSMGRYRVRHLLGQGAFGRVYEAHDPQLDRRVAIKVSKDLKGKGAIDRFLREARSAAHLRHPNIIPVFEYGQIDDLSMIVYELVDGETLRSYIKRKAPLPLSETITIVQKIANGLDYAHREGIIHRDMKPDNVLIDQKGEPHIADFGCARRHDDHDTHQTLEGSILGTPMYMSPEQASGGAHQADGRTDVWSLGVMLYEMVSGVKPFQGKLSDLLHLIRHQDPKPLRKVQPGTPRDIETICAKCLRRELDQRFATAGELADELERFRRGEPILSRRISLVHRTWLWAKRNRAVAGLISAVIVTLLMGAAFSSYFAIKAYYAQLARARVSLEQLTTADSDVLDGILVNLEGSEISMRDNIRRRMTEENLEPQERRRLHLGLLHLEKIPASKRNGLYDADMIIGDLLSADGRELLAFCHAFSEPEKADLSQRLWPICLDSARSNDARMRAACALAQLDPTSSNWEEQNIDGDIAGYLTALGPADVQQWLSAIEPIREKLRPKLQEQFAGTRSLDDASPETAAVILSLMLRDYVPDLDGDGELSALENELNDHELVAIIELVPDADARQLAHLMATLKSPPFRDQSTRLLVEKLGQLERIREPDPQRVSAQANLVLALIQLEQPDVWRKLKRSSDNSIRTEVIELLGPASTSVELLLKQLVKSNPDPAGADGLAAILLALGQFSNGQIPESRRNDIFNTHLIDIFKNHGDAYVHSSARWLMTRWGFDQQIAEMERVELPREWPEPGKNWHVDPGGNTFVVFEPADFVMGLASGLPPHLRRIPRRFGISIQETTIDQYEKFIGHRLNRKEQELESLDDSADDRAEKILVVEIDRHKKSLAAMSTMDKQRPITDVDFFRSLQYCRWQSEVWQLEPALLETERLERFYREGDGMGHDSIDLNEYGYRLPTAGEWEFVCRAGTDTLRSFGIREERLSAYAWFVSNSKNSTQPVTQLKPNEAGLFDMLGNVSEWCLDWYQRDLPPEFDADESNQALVDFTDSRQSPSREYRGGSFEKEAIDLHASARVGTSANKGFRYLGFRLARTYPPTDESDATASQEQPLP